MNSIPCFFDVPWSGKSLSSSRKLLCHMIINAQKEQNCWSSITTFDLTILMPRYLSRYSFNVVFNWIIVACFVQFMDMWRFFTSQGNNFDMYCFMSTCNVFPVLESYSTFVSNTVYVLLRGTHGIHFWVKMLMHFNMFN